MRILLKTARWSMFYAAKGFSFSKCKEQTTLMKGTISNAAQILIQPPIPKVVQFTYIRVINIDGLP